MLPIRKSVRLPSYAYTEPGAYFVTIVAAKRMPLFSEVRGSTLHLTLAGNILEACIRELPQHFPGSRLDTWVIMPNHVHAVFAFDQTLVAPNVRAGLRPAPTRTDGLPNLVGVFKSFTSRKIRRLRADPALEVWQRGYYERVIRNETELYLARRYILENPLRWDLDRENPGRGRDVHT